MASSKIQHDFWFQKSKDLLSYNECQNFKEFLCAVFQIKKFKGSYNG